MGFHFCIEAAGVCNLRCPSYPNGNWRTEKNPAGFLDIALLSRIMEKACSECDVTGVGLYNWGEPLLHP